MKAAESSSRESQSKESEGGGDSKGAEIRNGSLFKPTQASETILNIRYKTIELPG